MAMIVTRMNKIAAIEGFQIWRVRTKKTGKVHAPRANGVLGPYNQRKAPPTITVKHWKVDFFEDEYPGFTCMVLKGDGKRADDHTLLSAVRRSYGR